MSDKQVRSSQANSRESAGTVTGIICLIGGVAHAVIATFAFLMAIFMGVLDICLTVISFGIFGAAQSGDSLVADAYFVDPFHCFAACVFALAFFVAGIRCLTAKKVCLVEVAICIGCGVIMSMTHFVLHFALGGFVYFVGTAFLSLIVFAELQQSREETVLHKKRSLPVAVANIGTRIPRLQSRTPIADEDK